MKWSFRFRSARQPGVVGRGDVVGQGDVVGRGVMAMRRLVPAVVWVGVWYCMQAAFSFAQDTTSSRGAHAGERPASASGPSLDASGQGMPGIPARAPQAQSSSQAPPSGTDIASPPSTLPAPFGTSAPTYLPPGQTGMEQMGEAQRQGILPPTDAAQANDIAITEGTPKDDAGLRKQGMPVQRLEPFGRAFFVPARKKIADLERRIIRGEATLPNLAARDALAGFVGPLEMVTSSVYAGIPHRYVLTPGDQITLSYWARTLDLQTLPLVVDAVGEVSLPKVGKMVARGMTLDAFQNNVRAALARVTVNDLELIATLDRLKSMQIFITGSAFRPGSYAVSAVTTLFNALYAAGGPTDEGSLRDVRLIRGGQTIRIDFYDYLMRGDSQNDLPLHSGDTIFIPRLDRSVGIGGEVARPAIYEIKEGEHLAALVDLAGGVKSTGILQRVQIQSLSPHRERLVKEVDLATGAAAPNTPLYDGDRVTIFPVLPDAMNQIMLEGSVERPGAYELKPDMRVSDLFSEINRPLGEALMERADILRLNADKKTTTLYSIDLARALEEDPRHDLPLASLDRVIVYSKFAVAFHPSRIVSIFGAVTRPGVYVRSDAMRLSDLLLIAGGVLPGAHEKIEVARARASGEVALLQIGLPPDRILPESEDILLQDEDIVSLRKKSDFFDKPLFATLAGEVRYPGVYALKSRAERISDLVRRAGGLMDTAYPKGSIFTRNPAFMSFEAQRSDLALVLRVINQMNTLEYERRRAKNQYLLAKERGGASGPSGTSAPAATLPIKETETLEEAIALSQVPGTAQSTAGAAGSLVGGLVSTLEEGLSSVSKARQFGADEMQPSNRILVSIAEALRQPGGGSDLVLREGDTLTIPTAPVTVHVIGAVMRPSTIAYAAGKEGAHYVAQSGGLAPDADEDKILVSRVDSSILPIESVEAIEAGDMIFVPPKVVSLDVLTTVDKVIDVIKFTLVTLAGVGTFIALIGLL